MLNSDVEIDYYIMYQPLYFLFLSRFNYVRKSDLAAAPCMLLVLFDSQFLIIPQATV